MSVVEVSKIDEVYVRLKCEPGIAQELDDYFSFYIPGHRFHPKVKYGMWDGKIHLFSTKTKAIYAGLIKHVERFCEERNYEFEEPGYFIPDDFSVKEALDFIKTLNLPSHIQIRDYQVQSFAHCVRNRRSLFLSPTASGKSFIIYLLTRYFQKKTLVIVPRVSLLHQMFSDFEEYGFNSDANIHIIHEGKSTEKPLVFATWQSIYKQPKEWFDQFEMVVGDEAHNFKAKNLTAIMTKLGSCPYRFGFTGSLDGSQTHKLVLEGLFGPLKKLVTTAELIEQGHLADLTIKCILLQYSDEVRKSNYKLEYKDEIKFIASHKGRNKFIKNLALSLEGNVIILFRRVETHGKVLHDLIANESKVPVNFVAGEVESDEREQIRKLVNEQKQSITVASVGTFAEGINIPNIHYIIMASPAKSRIEVMQKIGRGLRKGSDKNKCIIFDLADDFSSKRWKNTTLKHFAERLKYYNEEKFKCKIYKVGLK